MKKLLYSVFFLSLISSLLSLVSISPVFAQDSDSSGVSLPEDKMIAPIYPGGSQSPFLGQSHFYSYVFRGNGEAVVTAKIVVANTSESETLNEVFLRFPDIEPKDITIYQIIGTGQCIRYDTPGFDQGRGGYYPPTCKEYGEPDYYGYYGTAKYQKAEFGYSGDTLTVKLPKTVAPQKSGAFFVHFRAFGIAHKTSFGAYKYDIETLKVDDQINQLTIGINTDSDLFLKGAKGEVDYRQVSDVGVLKEVSVTGEAMASPAIDSFLGNIGYGTITKSVSNLAPLESYKVSGMYAKSKFPGLYAKETLTGLGILFGIVIITVFVVWKILKSVNSKRKKDDQDVKNSENKKSDVTFGNVTSRFFITLGLSFLVAIVIALYTVTVIFVGGYLNNFSYQYQPYMTLFMVVISFCIYSFILFAPGIFWGYKEGIGWGIGLVVMTIFWLFVFLGITLLVIFFSGNGGGNGVSPMPLSVTRSSLE